MNRSSLPIGLNTLKKWWSSPEGVLKCSLPFQRHSGMWNLITKSMLVWSILADSYIPPIVLLKDKSGTNSKGKDIFSYQVLDGQQRLTTLFSFIDDEWSLHGSTPEVEVDGTVYDLEGIKFSEMSEECQDAIRNYEDVDSWKTVIFLYNAALKEVGTKLEILNDEFQHVHKYNPIEHIKTRIKTPESIVKKLKRYGRETSIVNMVKYINDIAGVRVICSFTSDIYRLAEMIGNQSDLKVLSIKDYIRNPKESGYKSYHMLVSIPIFLSDSVVDTKVEIQIRTIAMDFWASLEHKIYYKFEGNAPEYISRELQECAQMVSELDDKMLSLNEAIQACLDDNDIIGRE